MDKDGCSKSFSNDCRSLTPQVDESLNDESSRNSYERDLFPVLQIDFDARSEASDESEKVRPSTPQIKKSLNYEDAHISSETSNQHLNQKSLDEPLYLSKRLSKDDQNLNERSNSQELPMPECSYYQNSVTTQAPNTSNAKTTVPLSSSAKCAVSADTKQQSMLPPFISFFNNFIEDNNTACSSEKNTGVVSVSDNHCNNYELTINYKSESSISGTRQICERSDNIFEFPMHINTHSVEKLPSCSSGDLTFTQHTEPKLHEGERDKERKQCYICGKEYVSKSQYETHLRMHAGDMLYECDICDARFTHYGYLASHKRTHVISFKCPICDNMCADQNVFVQHMSTHSQEKPYTRSEEAHEIHSRKKL